MKSELANCILDRVSMYVAPIRQPPVRKGNEAHERNWSFNFESGELLLGARGENHAAQQTKCTSSISRDIAGRCNTSMLPSCTWAIALVRLPNVTAATLTSRNEGNVAPINATKLFFLQPFQM